ncbi:ECF RNA polymerase sigma factor SigH [Maioricimonas rarisocia]|uniref:ECF RNA polymerase sigma factor SigH n=1 Tax=Maioricimonas rarisocia TaxID=2528026 RepID=A0A517ZEZ7_9PLAN|nr:sigma-70 family RNA polymerase sigma factor [Maioricimonas rarisocia]QDU41057.1 ECF RNA polymerase sigma factor SigH [Maioricimonas rarisocia]
MPHDDRSSLIPLLDRARSGEASARDELFAKCRNYVAVIAQSRLESWMHAKVDASDLVQQTLLEAFRGIEDFRGQTDAEWLAWLRQILSHNTNDFIRRYRTDKRAVGRERSLAPAEPDDSRAPGRDPADPGKTPSQIVADHERDIQIADAIARLAEDHRQVILLRNLQRLPFDEIARRMDRSRPAVQMLWMRALRKLEELLHQPDS